MREGYVQSREEMAGTQNKGAAKSAMKLHRALISCLGMIFSENRFTLSGSCPGGLEVM